MLSWLLALNFARVLMVLGGLALIWLCAERAFTAMTKPQRARFAALAVAAGILAGEQIERLGDRDLSWRAAPTALVLALGIYGCWRFDPLVEAGKP